MTALDVEIPVAGQLTRLASDLWWARLPLPFRLDHINLYLLDCEDGWLVIDCGINNADTDAHWQALLNGPLKGQKISRILVSHHHVDHIGYCAPLAARTGAEVLIGAEEEAHCRWIWQHEDDAYAALMARTYHAHGLDSQAITTVIADRGKYRRMVAEIPPCRRLEAGSRLLSRDGSWQVRIDEGHSSGQIGLTDHQRGLYIAMDFLLPRISPNISADIRDLHRDILTPYLEYLQEMTRLDGMVKIFPGHDWPFRNAADRAEELIRHHHDRLQQLLKAAHTAPLTTATAMDTLFGKLFGPHELYFAAGEARAHLNTLVARGQLHRHQHKEKGRNEVDIFTLA